MGGTRSVVLIFLKERLSLMMGEFLAANNTWGQHLLKLVARGNAVIAELLRLKDYIPPVYR